MAEDNIGDFELESLRTYMDGKLDRLREEMIERIQAGLDELEKRTLLRTAGGGHCRICWRQSKTEPPISRLEDDWHSTGHGELTQDYSAAAAGRPRIIPRARDWGTVEKILADFKKRSA